MMTQWYRVLFVGALAGLSGCGTVIRGWEEEVSVVTEPNGAQVSFSNGQTCNAPCVITAARRKPVTVTVRMAGCRSEVRELVPTVPERGSLWFTVIDHRTGGAYDLMPNPLTVKLSCGNKVLTAPALTAADQDVIGSFGQVYEVPDAEPSIPAEGERKQLNRPLLQSPGSWWDGTRVQ